jgi:hypothetical protein
MLDGSAVTHHSREFVMNYGLGGGRLLHSLLDMILLLLGYSSRRIPSGPSAASSLRSPVSNVIFTERAFFACSNAQRTGSVWITLCIVSAERVCWLKANLPDSYSDGTDHRLCSLAWQRCDARAQPPRVQQSSWHCVRDALACDAMRCDDENDNRRHTVRRTEAWQSERASACLVSSPAGPWLARSA